MHQKRKFEVVFSLQCYCFCISYKMVRPAKFGLNVSCYSLTLTVLAFTSLRFSTLVTPAWSYKQKLGTPMPAVSGHIPWRAEQVHLHCKLLWLNIFCIEKSWLFLAFNPSLLFPLHCSLPHDLHIVRMFLMLKTIEYFLCCSFGIGTW